MRHPRITRALITLCLSLVAIATLALARGRNLAPDAVTRATTWNEHEGDIAALTDGIVPPTEGVLTFQWNSKGILVFAWDGVQTVERVRLRTGGIANDYQVRAYVGGHLQDEGSARDPQGELTARVDDRSRVVDDWQDILLPANTEADNVEVRNLGPVQLFEVEILTPESTTVLSATSWATVKHPPPTGLSD